ncbi:hypothetical protein LCGC14_1202890 [marine sediment metagenome]|uniref:Cyclin-like domain-containing protein n=1 Tax=marine sediment metagenome TaxID=412755 RepID=A0A0F9LGC4_9ZZZZ
MQLNLSVKYSEPWYSELLDYKKKLNIQPAAFNDAIKIFESSRKNKLSSGRSIKILILASVYCALKVHAIYIDLKEYIIKLQASLSVVKKMYRTIETQILPKLKLHPHRFSIIDYINHFADELKLISDCKMKAIELINILNSKEIDFSGKDPKIIAGAAIYISSRMINISLTQEKIIRVVKSTLGTLQNRIRDIKKNLY